ncbi:MAG: phosphoglycerate kinase, partial [Candidatus Rokuibacteriota bacterium]
MAKLVVDQLDLSGKRVFLRADFNVPLEGARVTDDTRIAAVGPTLDCCLKAGASLVIASHLGRPKGKPDPKYSLRPVAERVEALLGRPVPLLPDCVGPEVAERARALRPGEVVLLENLRFHAEEEANDEAFA